MEDINTNSNEYEAYSESYFTTIPNKDQDINIGMEENFTFMGTTPFPNGTTTNVTQVGRDEFLAKIEQVVLCLIFILTISGNFLVLMGIYFRNQKMTRMYYFIVHLSIADLTTAFFNVLTQLFWEFTHR